MRPCTNLENPKEVSFGIAYSNNRLLIKVARRVLYYVVNSLSLREIILQLLQRKDFLTVSHLNIK